MSEAKNEGRTAVEVNGLVRDVVVCTVPRDEFRAENTIEILSKHLEITPPLIPTIESVSRAVVTALVKAEAEDFEFIEDI